MRSPISALALGCFLWLQCAGAAATTVLDADFASDADGFSYADDTFRGSSEPDYASGSWVADEGYRDGALRVTLGNNGSDTVTGMSGGWQRSFSVPSSGEFELFFRYRLTQSPDYESSEHSQVMVRLDSSELGGFGTDYVAQITGNGNGGASRSTGWREFRANVGTLGSGSHSIVVGGYNNQKSQASEFTDIWIDELRVATPETLTPDPAVQVLVDDLDLESFKSNIEFLSSPDPPINGSRHWSQPGNAAAVAWIVAQLESYGYTNVVQHPYSYSGSTRYNVYATKVGTLHPEEMYFVSAHLDSKTTDGSGDAAAAGADDDGSGTSLVLEAARVFASPDVETVYSVRFAFWNNEEQGLIGSGDYVSDFVADQGIENPSGSGQYPEPLWRGMLQHDMILYDHGLPPQPTQIPGADLDIEYLDSATYDGFAVELANATLAANVAYATEYPAEVTDQMSNTDSARFQNHTAAISLRENRRLAELGNGSNPYYHASTDVYGSYSELDYLFGFNFVQTTVATVAELAGATLVNGCGDGVPQTGEECDDGNTQDGDCCSSTCEYEDEGSLCDDDDACTEGTTCNATGVCGSGSAVTCDDAEPCTDDSCSPASGCVFTPNSDPCDDGDACTVSDICSEGSCQPGSPLVCDDAEPCTDDGCSPASGCVFTPNSDPCDDGDACSDGDVCSGGSCQPGPPLACDDSEICTDDSCDSVGGCVFTPADGYCDDGDACTALDRCSDGVCQAGPTLDCGDGNACTEDSCDPILGCLHDPVEPCTPIPTLAGPWRLIALAALLGIALGFSKRGRAV
jgi:cysteine-rich repeat protein